MYILLIPSLGHANLAVCSGTLPVLTGSRDSTALASSQDICATLVSGQMAYRSVTVWDVGCYSGAELLSMIF